MKIDQIKAAYSQQSHSIAKPAAGNGFSESLTSAVNNEIFTKDEKQYFDDMFPGMDAESHVQNNYERNGRLYSFQLGQKFDKKG